MHGSCRLSKGQNNDPEIDISLNISLYATNAHVDTQMKVQINNISKMLFNYKYKNKQLRVYILNSLNFLK